MADQAPYGAVIDPESGVVYVPENGESAEEQNSGAVPEVDPNEDTVYDTEDGELNDAEPSPTPTPDPRDAWFDSMYTDCCAEWHIAHTDVLLLWHQPQPILQNQHRGCQSGY